MNPRELSIRANDLVQSVLEWAPAAPEGEVASAPPTVVLLHGFMDAAGTWGEIAPSLVAAGFRVLAPHQRGFGRAPRVPEGGYYYFPDYVFDLADVVDACVPRASASEAPPRVSVVGHSMGGTVATLYAGSFPERIERLALLEGTGPFDNPFETAPIRMRRWIEDVRRARTASARPVGTHEDVLARLVQNHSGVKPEVLARRVPELARVGEDGVLSWLADPLHRTLSPMPFYVEAYKAFARRVACPVLSVDGGPSGFQPPDESDRLACFASVRRETLAGAGHMLHWTEPGAVSALLVDFLGPARDVRV